MTEKEKKELEYYTRWAKKSPKSIRKELTSFKTYFEKNEPYYNWHGRYTSHPDELMDSDRVRVLEKLLTIKEKLYD